MTVPLEAFCSLVRDQGLMPSHTCAYLQHFKNGKTPRRHGMEKPEYCRQTKTPNVRRGKFNFLKLIQNSTQLQHWNAIIYSNPVRSMQAALYTTRAVVDIVAIVFCKLFSCVLCCSSAWLFIVLITPCDRRKPSVPGSTHDQTSKPQTV